MDVLALPVILKHFPVSILSISKGVVARGVGRRKAKNHVFFYALVFFGDGLSAQALMRSWALDVFLPSLPLVFSVLFFLVLAGM